MPTPRTFYEKLAALYTTYRCILTGDHEERVTLTVSVLSDIEGGENATEGWATLVYDGSLEFVVRAAYHDAKQAGDI